MSVLYAGAVGAAIYITTSSYSSVDIRSPPESPFASAGNRN